MVRPTSIRRTLAALVLLAATVAILASFGRWQLHRADERRAVLAAIEAGRKQPALVLAPDTASTELTPWRRARVSGHWLNERSVWLENRNYKGQPGYWVATPMALDDQAHNAVLVLRGWVPRGEPGAPPPPLPAAPAGAQMIEGELTPHVPRLFELWSFGAKPTDTLPPRLPAADGAAPRVQNLDLASYAQASGLTLIPAVLEQTVPEDPSFVREWPQPSVDFNQNLGYAFQWFSFAAIAAIAWLIVLFRAIRRFRSARATRTPT